MSKVRGLTYTKKLSLLLNLPVLQNAERMPTARSQKGKQNMQSISYGVRVYNKKINQYRCIISIRFYIWQTEENFISKLIWSCAVDLITFEVIQPTVSFHFPKKYFCSAVPPNSCLNWSYINAISKKYTSHNRSANTK